VLVSDIGLPDRDGYDLMRTVRRRGVSIPAIALTAFASDDDAELARSAGFQQHLAKPVAPAAIIHAVERAVGAGAGSGVAAS